MTTWRFLKMKRTIILALSILMVFSISISSLAAEDTTQVTGEVNQESSVKTEAEVEAESPDSFLYYIKRLYEQFKLITTFNEESKLDLHIDLAEKRLQELSTLDADQKSEFSTELYAEFLANIEKAIMLTLELKEQQKEVDDTLAELEEVVSGGETLITQLESEIELEIKEEDQETRELAKVAPSVVAHIDAEIISELRDEGFGYGQIALIVSMSEQSDVSLDEVKELVREHKGMGKVAKMLGLHPGNLIKKGKLAAELEEDITDEDAQEEASEEESTEEESTTSLETEQELDTEASTSIQLDNVGLNMSSKGKANAKAAIESNGKGKAKGLYKDKHEAKGNGKLSVEVKTNAGLGIGIGNGKNDR
jgi:hypothetical protein